MNRLKRVGLIVCSMAFLLSLTACFPSNVDFNPADYQSNSNFSFTNYTNKQPNATKPLTEEDTQFVSTYEKITENAFLTLYLDKNTTFIAVADKRSGKVWYSNSPKLDEGSVVESDAINLLKSQLMVDFLEYQAFKSVGNYTASILNKNFVIHEIRNGISIVYSFMEEVVDTLNTDKSEDVSEDGEFGDESDDDESGDEGSEETAPVYRKLFDITLEYTLDNECLIANVPLDKIQYTNETPPLNITLLQDFGSSNDKQDGYLFVPDGSGALIRFDSKKMNSSPLKTHVYGIDTTLDNLSRPSMVQNANMPVFGLKEKNQAFLTIIEDSAAIATISAYPAGVLSDMNEVFSTYNILSYQNVSIGLNSQSKFISVQKKMYPGSIRVRYAFMDLDDADYVGMAQYYQRYLVDKHELKPLQSRDVIPANIELIGAIDKIQSFLGMNYHGIEPLTTFEQAEQILQDLMKNNISNMHVKYTGWFNGGFNQEYAGNFDLDKKLGGGKQFRQLVEFTKQQGLSLYPNVTFMTSPSQSKGFSTYRTGAKVLDQKDSRLYTYDKVSLVGNAYRNIVKPSILQTLMDRFYSRITKYGVQNISFDEIGSAVYADYDHKQIVDRQSASNYYHTLLKQQKSQYTSIMVNGANDYAVTASDVVLNAPLHDSGFYMIDTTVPFFSIVYHGYKDYSSGALNLAVSHDDEVLKSIEYGALPYYQLIYAEGSATKNTDYSHLCSNNYEVWKDKISKTYTQMNGALADVYSARIVDHQQLSEKVYKTTYSNGVAVIVNYRDEAVETELGKVEARGFITVKGVK